MSRHTDPALADLERQIAETREQLGRTVEELAAKADVPARARAKATQTAARTKARAAHAADRVKHRAGRGRTPAEEPTVVVVSPAGGAHRAGGAPPARGRERTAYGAAAIGLAAATAGAAVWAARKP